MPAGGHTRRSASGLLLLLALSGSAGISFHTQLFKTSSTTAKDVLDHYKPDLRGKVALVTGGNSGIGMETCKALCAAGARVIMCSRKVEGGEETVEKYIRAHNISGYAVPDAQIEVKQLDLADLHSIQRLGDSLRAEPRIDLLVLNAGVMGTPKSTTPHGFETHMGTNHHGHHFLTSILRPQLAAAGAARVVVVSSNAHRAACLDLGDLHYERGRYNPWRAYGNSKAANILFAKSLADQGLRAASVHPGVISTNLQQHILRWPVVKQIFPVLTKLGLGFRSVPQGAATSVWACVCPDWEFVPGAYLQDCAPADPSRWAQDRMGDRRARLWETTEAQIRAALVQPAQPARVHA